MISVTRHIRFVISLCGLVLLLSLTAQAQDPMEAWKNYNFRDNAIKQAQVQNLELYELKLIRGLVFGRHGRVFKDGEIDGFLKEQSWYKADPDFSNSMLNDTERRSLDVIRIAEAAKHETIQPGDMRYWRDRAITAKKLGKHSGAEWKVLIAEVEAIHGKRFDDDPWLQKYFDERYWYVSSDKYDAKKLTPIEVKNIEILSGAQRRQRNVALLPGDMEYFENKTVTEQMLHGLSLHELRCCVTRFMRGTGACSTRTGCSSIFRFNPGTQRMKTSKMKSYRVMTRSMLRRSLSTRIRFTRI